MKTRVLLPAIILTVLAAHAQSLGASNSDHLLPVDLKQFSRYRHLLRSTLGVTPFNCGRWTLWPPFQGEVCLSVYEISGNGKRTCFVTYIAAEQNLYQRTEAAQHPERARAVKIDRIDGEIPERTAHLLKEVWTRMLTGPHGAAPTPPPKKEMISIDGTIMEWSLERRGAPPLYGMLDVSLPYPGDRTRLFVKLSNDLYEYCKAAPEKRLALADKINREARQLLAKLESKH